MKKLVLGASIAAVCAAATLNAVTFGRPDGTRHPSIAQNFLSQYID